MDHESIASLKARIATEPEGNGFVHSSLMEGEDPTALVRSLLAAGGTTTAVTAGGGPDGVMVHWRPRTPEEMVES
jgi:hypothetical protein